MPQRSDWWIRRQWKFVRNYWPIRGLRNRIQDAGWYKGKKKKSIPKQHPRSWVVNFSSTVWKVWMKQIELFRGDWFGKVLNPKDWWSGGDSLFYLKARPHLNHLKQIKIFPKKTARDFSTLYTSNKSLLGQDGSEWSKVCLPVLAELLPSRIQKPAQAWLVLDTDPCQPREPWWELQSRAGLASPVVPGGTTNFSGCLYRKPPVSEALHLREGPENASHSLYFIYLSTNIFVLVEKNTNRYQINF